MALTDGQFGFVRRRLRPYYNGPINVTKPDVNAAIQAVYDRMDAVSTRQAIGSDIETAAPGAFTAAQKVAIAGVVIEEFAKRELEVI